MFSAQDLDFPAEAGLPIGHDESPDYFMMEVHYDNPAQVPNIVDNSGNNFGHISFASYLRRVNLS